MNRDRLRRARREIVGLADDRLDRVSLAQAIVPTDIPGPNPASGR